MGTGTGLRQFLCPGQENKSWEGVRGGGGGGGLVWQVQESISSRRLFEVLWNLECTVGYLAQFGQSAHKF